MDRELTLYAVLLLVILVCIWLRGANPTKYYADSKEKIQDNCFATFLMLFLFGGAVGDLKYPILEHNATYITTPYSLTITALSIGVVLALCVAMLFRKWQRDWKETIWNAFFTFTLGTVAAVGNLQAINGAMDNHLPQQYQTIVLSKRRTSSKGKRHYYLVINRKTIGRALLNVEPTTFDNCGIGSQITLTLSSGFLGWERVLSVRC